jgi:hypothetical protein
LIVAVCSSYREGAGFGSTLDSALRGCDYVYVLDGPIGDAPPVAPGDYLDGLEEHISFRVANERLTIEHGSWASDADKRSHALFRVKGKYSPAKGDSLWVLWLDGDELLLWPEYLQDWTRRVDAETGAGGFAIRIVEYDGSVAKCYGKIIRADRVRRYVHSSYHVELHTGIEVALPNVPLCQAGGIPILPSGIDQWGELSEADRARWLADARPPIQGEPHLLHRSWLRDPGRTIARQSDAEGELYAEVDRELGL